MREVRDADRCRLEVGGLESGGERFRRGGEGVGSLCREVDGLLPSRSVTRWDVRPQWQPPCPTILKQTIISTPARWIEVEVERGET